MSVSPKTALESARLYLDCVQRRISGNITVEDPCHPSAYLLSIGVHPVACNAANSPTVLIAPSFFYESLFAPANFGQ